MQVNPYLFYNGNCEAAFKYTPFTSQPENPWG